MKKYMAVKTKLDLIGDIIALILSKEYDASILSMAHDCNVPISYMRKAILSILDNKILFSCIYSNTFQNKDNENISIIDEYLDNKNLFRQRVLNGYYDEITWDITLGILDSSEDELLTLTPAEYGAIRTLGENALSLKRGSLFEKKENVSPISAETLKSKKNILEAISNNYTISFFYKNKNNTNTYFVKCFPIDLFTNTTDNWLYFRASDGMVYRLDRIVHGCKVIKEPSLTPQTPISENLKYVWGSFYNTEEQPTHVVVRISPDTWNIIKKIKNDIKFRRETCKFYQRNEYYYFEDDIIGMSEFRRWVRSYGSSMILLEPKSAANEIVERAHQTLALYEASNSWKNL